MIGNGDLDSPEKVVTAFHRLPGRWSDDRPRCVGDALGCLLKPQRLCAANTIPPEPTLNEQREIVLRHFQLVVNRFGPERGTFLMRKFAACYSQGRPGARYFRTYIQKASIRGIYRGSRSLFPAR